MNSVPGLIYTWTRRGDDKDCIVEPYPVPLTSDGAIDLGLVIDAIVARGGDDPIDWSKSKMETHIVVSLETGEMVITRSRGLAAGFYEINWRTLLRRYTVEAPAELVEAATA